MITVNVEVSCIELKDDVLLSHTDTNEDGNGGS